MSNTTHRDTGVALAGLLEGTTPGPWDNADGLIVGEDYIATVYDHSNPNCSPQYAKENAVLRARHEANARLIASAPALAASHAQLVAALAEFVLPEPTPRGQTGPRTVAEYDALPCIVAARTALANARAVTEGRAK